MTGAGDEDFDSDEPLHDDCCWCGTCDCEIDDDGKHHDPKTGALMAYSKR